MTHIADDEIRVELKYCERCGGLWFRLEHSRDVLCAPCRQKQDTTLEALDRPSALPPRKPAARVEADAWYGPTTTIVKLLQGVSEPCGSVASLDLRSSSSVRPSTSGVRRCAGGAA